MINKFKLKILSMIVVLITMFFGVNLNNAFALSDNLLSAIDSGDVDRVRELAQNRYNLKADGFGRTALMYASVSLGPNSKRIIDVLRENGCSMTQFDIKGINSYSYARIWYDNPRNHTDNSDEWVNYIGKLSGRQRVYRQVEEDKIYNEILDWKNNISSRRQNDNIPTIIRHELGNELRNRNHNVNTIIGRGQETATVATSVVPVQQYRDDAEPGKLNAMIDLLCNGVNELGDDYSLKEKEIYRNAKEISENNSKDRSILYMFFRFLDGNGRVSHEDANKLLECFDAQVWILNEEDGLVLQYKVDASDYKQYAFYYMMMTIYLTITHKEDSISRVVVNRISRDFALKVVVDKVPRKEAADSSINKYYNKSICCGRTVSDINNLVSYLFETIAEYKNLPRKIDERVLKPTEQAIYSADQAIRSADRAINQGTRLINSVNNTVETLNNRLDQRVLIPMQGVLESISARIAYPTTWKATFENIASNVIASLIPRIFSAIGF